MKPVRIVVMGVCGCGKSSVGEQLARALKEAQYLEGDDFHPPRNVALMAAGTALTDADRQGWLQALAEQLRTACQADRSVVLGCSALKRSYRDVLRGGAPGLVIVHLTGSAELLGARLAGRQHRYMPATLLASQLATLEPPQPDEGAITIDIAAPTEDIVSTVLTRLAGVKRT